MAGLSDLSDLTLVYHSNNSTMFYATILLVTQSYWPAG